MSSPPIIQRSMRLTSAKSLVYWTSTEAALQNIDTVMPASSSVAGGSARPVRAGSRTITAAIVPAAPASAAAARPSPARRASPSSPSRIAITGART